MRSTTDVEHYLAPLDAGVEGLGAAVGTNAVRSASGEENGD